MDSSKKKKITEMSDSELLAFDNGFVNAIGAIFHGLDTHEQGIFSDMVIKALKDAGKKTLEDGIAEKALDSNCPEGCICHRDGTMDCNASVKS